jgi:conjugative transfer region protein (TIGR03750 family)
MDAMPAPLADRVNVEPPIIGGMSHTELMLVGGLSFTLLFIATVVLGCLTHAWVLLAVLPAGGTVGVIAVASKHLASLKRNRPDGYHLQWLRMVLSRVGLGRMPVIAHRGHWRLGRDL